MKLSRLFHARKSRKYPIKRDQEGLSSRAKCFELFEQKKRPTMVAEELKMKETTVCRYFRDWKRLGPDLKRRYAFAKELLRKDATDRENNVEIFSRMLGIEKEEFETILSRPHGLRQFVTGKLYFPLNADIDRKRHIIFKLAVLISDHVITNGGNFEDVFYALRRYMQAHRQYREDVDADIEAWNKDMQLFHAVLAVEMEKEKERRIKPDTLSERERNTLIRIGIEQERKGTEILYWLRIGALMAGGLTPEQAREKMYQDLVEKGDLEGAKMMREFQDRVHPLENNNKTR
jgi:hypothetical protein